MNNVSKSDITKHKLIKAGLNLFPRYGFEGTTTRIISQESGVNLSAIALYFGSKQGLYDSCVDYLLQRIDEYYDENINKIEKMYSEGQVNKETAYSALGILIDNQIRAALNPKNRNTMAMIYLEEFERENEGKRPLGTRVLKKQEILMANLIRVVADVTDEHSRIISRHINGGIIAFGEHPDLAGIVIEGKGKNKKMTNMVAEIIQEDCMTIIDGVISKYGRTE